MRKSFTLDDELSLMARHAELPLQGDVGHAGLGAVQVSGVSSQAGGGKVPGVVEHGGPPEPLLPELLVDPLPELLPEPLVEPLPEPLPEPLVEPLPEVLPEPLVEPLPELLPELLVEPQPELLPELLVEPVPELPPELLPDPLEEEAVASVPASLAPTSAIDPEQLAARATPATALVHASSSLMREILYLDSRSFSLHACHASQAGVSRGALGISVGELIAASIAFASTLPSCPSSAPCPCPSSPPRPRGRR
jgi:hypothetical protein